MMSKLKSVYLAFNVTSICFHIMSTARWSLRLPRTLTTKSSGVLRSPGRRQNPCFGLQQQRWLRNRPPPRSNAPKDNDADKRQPDSGYRQPQSSQTNRSQEQGEHIGGNTQLAETLARSDTSDLVTEVHIPDDPNGILPNDHPARSILGQSSVVIQRQIEFMNLMIGFEQANKYIIMSGEGETIGYIAEQDHGIGSSMMRQLAKTHRSFTTHIFDKNEREVLRIHRPFAYINSRIRIYDPVPKGGYDTMDQSTALQGTSVSSVTGQGAGAQVSPLKLDEMRIIGEAQQQWAPLRRKYNLFNYRALGAARDDDTLRVESGESSRSVTVALTESKTTDAAIEAGMMQFAHVNEPLLSYDFTLRDEEQQTIGSVNRNFSGFAREIFTDTGVYALRMDSAGQIAALETGNGEEVARYERKAMSLPLDQRAVMLALAVSIDFDYFSRHSHVGGGGGFMPIFWPMGGGAAEGGAAGAGAGAAGGAVGAAEGAEGVAGAAGAAGRLGGAAGAGDGAIAGASAMAGYEAMQRGVYGSGGDSQAPQQDSQQGYYGPDGSDAIPDLRDSPYRDSDFGPTGQDNAPVDGRDAWGEGNDPWSNPPSTGEGGGGGGWLDSISDFFGGD